MSVTIYTKAQRKLTQDNLAAVKLYNELIESSYAPPDELIDDLRELLGNWACEWGETKLPIAEIPGVGDLVESDVESEGDVMYSSGMVIRIADLPEGTESLRIYTEA